MTHAVQFWNPGSGKKILFHDDSGTKKIAFDPACCCGEICECGCLGNNAPSNMRVDIAGLQDATGCVRCDELNGTYICAWHGCDYVLRQGALRYVCHYLYSFGPVENWIVDCGDPNCKLSGVEVEIFEVSGTYYIDVFFQGFCDQPYNPTCYHAPSFRYTTAVQPNCLTISGLSIPINQTSTCCDGTETCNLTAA
jgi:hypothetical protein